MPAALSHALLAEKVLAMLHQDRPDLNIREAGYFWGAQGPDFFFFHRFLPWQKGESLQEYGGRLHEAPPAQTLQRMRVYIKAHPDRTEAASYVLGFLTHFAFDSTAHPFVRYGARQLHLQQQPSTEDTCHNAIESALDVILLRYEKAGLPTDVNLKKLVSPDKAAQTEIAALYRELLSGIFGAEVSDQKLLEALSDCRSTLGLITDRTLIKRPFLQWVERKRKSPPTLSCHLRGISEGDDYDYANILQAEWSWPPESEQVRTESFLELYEQAAVYAEQLILGFLSGESMKTLVGERTF